MNVYMTIFRNQFTEADMIKESDENYGLGQAVGGSPPVPPEW